ncbi:MAG TPA: CoA-binding protein [Candidatus Competibacteraceae bacterium]|nr:CoA-binding protein [Candidatus Competibacteraceae bacterium]
MYKKGVGDFKYFVGIRSLAEVATREDRVCVLNILGGESSAVTPVSHAYSGGNVVFGTSPGRGGQVLKTPAGDIPVFNNVREGLDAGHRFNTGVVYLPPAGVRDGVAELIRVNPELKKIVMITEKVSVHDAREIRAMGQQHGIDIFGANCLGVADAWHQVRIGGALGGDDPGESLIKGSIALYSNSGNFTTTIAQYLATAGWGTTTLLSSGKDVYIHFAAPEFAYALANDERSRAAVMYVEPGGYYEHGLEFTKPVVACVVGRWKAKLTRAVGHAGAMAGSGDDAEAKERWFMEQFGVNAPFTPDNPVCSEKGAVVTNIAHIPLALTKVMELNGIAPDFAPRGSLALKPWFGNNQGLSLPAELDLPVVEAIPPYNAQIAELSRQIGRIFPRQPMKDCSGASQMDPKTQITRVHGVSILEAAREPLESNLCQALLREFNGANDNALVNVAIGAEVNLYGTPMLAAADAAREAGNAPNAVLSAAASILGPKRIEAACRAADTLIELFAHAGLNDARDESFDLGGIAVSDAERACFLAARPDPKAEAMLRAVQKRGAKSLFLTFLRGLGGPVSADAVLAAITTTIAWGPLMRKRISRVTARNLPWHFRLYATLIGASVAGAKHEAERFCGVPTEELLERWTVTELAYLTLMGEKADPERLFAFQVLVGILISNGPGSISAQGAKGAVSADGPQAPERVQINKAMVGFLTHTGYSHGGAGYEGITFLVEQFRDTPLTDPAARNHGLDLRAMATRYAVEYGREKAALKELGGERRAIAGLNHPVFKDKPVNVDPREAFLAELFKSRGEYNVFHDYYHALARALFIHGITRNVFCVNIDAVIGALLLKMLWPRYRSGTFSEHDLEVAAFTIFLYGRMIGCSAEIDDHLNRGRNMDTRTPASQLRFVS